MTNPHRERSFLGLPAEIRNHILEYVFEDTACNDGSKGKVSPSGAGVLVDDHGAGALLQPLLVCKQIHEDAALLAFSRTTFNITSLFFNVPQRLSILQPKQISSIRSIAFRADDRHFRKLQTWGHHPFGLPTLQLETLTIVLHRSSFWHYLFDFTSDMTKLLRNLQGVQRFILVRNGALVKGSFKTWYNRLVGLMLKLDHQERYLVSPPNPERTWWKWSYDEVAQKICLEARPSKPFVDEATYMEQILPLVEELRISVEGEEWNPDPRARNHYY